MMKRLRELLGARSARTETIEIQTSVNPMSCGLLIGMSKYAPGKAPCALPDEINTPDPDAMSEISIDECDFVPIDEKIAKDVKGVEEAVSGDESDQWLYDRDKTPLLVVPDTVLAIKQGFFVTNSPDGVEQLELGDALDLDDGSTLTDLSPIVFKI